MKTPQRAAVWAIRILILLIILGSITFFLLFLEAQREFREEDRWLAEMAKWHDVPPVKANTEMIEEFFSYCTHLTSPPVYSIKHVACASNVLHTSWLLVLSMSPDQFAIFQKAALDQASRSPSPGDGNSHVQFLGGKPDPTNPYPQWWDPPQRGIIVNEAAVYDPKRGLLFVVQYQ
jgi:hypothetical protein